MSTIEKVVSRKGGQVFTIGPHATVLDAALIMNEHKVGALIVLENNHIQGIVTERDVLQRVVAQRLDPAKVKIESIMTQAVICCEPCTAIDEARNIFMNRRIRHLPVVDAEDGLVAMVSIGDINAYELNGAESTIHYLHEYLYGQGQV